MNQLLLFSRVTEYVSSDLVKEGGATYRFQRSGKYLSCVIVYFTFDQLLLLLLLLLYKCVLQAAKQARLSCSLRPKLCVYLRLSATWQPPSEEESAYLQKCFLRCRNVEFVTAERGPLGDGLVINLFRCLLRQEHVCVQSRFYNGSKDFQAMQEQLN